MILSIFSVHDQKADAFLPPFFLPKIEMAQRVFADCCKSDSHQFGSNPQDYTLFHLGTFDDESGEIYQLEKAKISLGNGLEYAHNASPQSEAPSNGKAKISNAASILPGAASDNSA